MSYIYKKIVQGKPYYYLRISKRLNGKQIVKDIAYLGNDLAKINKKLDELPIKYKSDIRKGYKTIKKFIESNHYLEKAKELKLKKNNYIKKENLENIEAIRLHFNNYFLKFDKKTIEDTYKIFLIEFAYNTTSIEGNTITLEEARKLLADNLTPNEKSPREIFDLQNTEKVFFYLINNNPKINQDLIIKVHDMLIDNIDARKGYRTHDIRVFKSNFDCSPGKFVITDIKILFKWYEKNKEMLHPLVLAVLFHHKLEKIHPFSDGNGRTGRMIMNYLLINYKYPPLIIQKKNRKYYLDALSKADESGLESIGNKYFNDLVEYCCEEFVNSYWNNFNI